MSITRWDPFRELEEVSDRLNRVFGRSALRTMGNRENLAVPDWSPTVDISETPEEYIIKAELPEVKKEDVKLSIENGILRLEGERKQEKEEKNKKYHRIERSYGQFLRTFSLPDNADESKVRAEYKDGVLNIHLMKAEKAKQKNIEVKIS